MISSVCGPVSQHIRTGICFLFSTLVPPSARSRLPCRFLPQLKIAALCPIPASWTFKFDDLQQDAVYIENNVFDQQSFSRKHPMDAFFLELLKRLRRRHNKWANTVDGYVADRVMRVFGDLFLLDDRKIMCAFFTQKSLEARNPQNS